MSAPQTIETVLATAPRPLPADVVERLLRDFDRLCWQLARRIWHHPRGQRAGELDDFLSVARYALIEAAERFDATRGLKFITFAHRFAWGRLQSARNRTCGLIHIPAHTWLRNSWRHTEARDRALRVGPLPLLGSDGAGDIAAPAPRERLEPDEMALVRRALTRLTARQRLVVTRRFGLDDRPRGTLEEIGAELGLTPERVRQIQSHAMRRLRRFCLAEGVAA